VLASGLTIRQDFRRAMRFVFFETGIAEYPYATHGGTAFIVNYRGKCYGLTAAHVRAPAAAQVDVANHAFYWEQLVITEKTVGTRRAPLRRVYYPSAPRGEAIGSDIVDVVVLEFVEPITSEFFEGTAYLIDNTTVASSADGHRLLVSGNLKEQTTIADDIAPVYVRLEFTDGGISRFDSTVRMGVAKYQNAKFNSLAGVSGAPVYDETANALCGMVLRGGQGKDGLWRIYFADMFDIMHFLDAVHRGEAAATLPAPPRGRHFF